MFKKTQNVLGACSILLALALASCAGFEERVAAELEGKPNARILVLGDSVMWWNAEEGGSVADVLARELGEPVVNLAVPGAAVSHANPAMADEGLDIRAQYRPRAWDWVVVEGGANDLGDEGGQLDCAAVRDTLISADGGSGEIPTLVQRIRGDGARVVALGYYALPAGPDADSFCGDALAAVSQRIETMAAQDPGVFFVSMADVVSPDDLSGYDSDRVHPSARTSAAIAQKIAQTIRVSEGRTD